jgi:hypothetical protein
MSPPPPRTPRIARHTATGTVVISSVTPPVTSTTTIDISSLTPSTVTLAQTYVTPIEDSPWTKDLRQRLNQQLHEHVQLLLQSWAIINTSLIKTATTTGLVTATSLATMLPAESTVASSELSLTRSVGGTMTMMDEDEDYDTSNNETKEAKHESLSSSPSVVRSSSGHGEDIVMDAGEVVIASSSTSEPLVPHPSQTSASSPTTTTTELDRQLFVPKLRCHDPHRHIEFIKQMLVFLRFSCLC